MDITLVEETPFRFRIERRDPMRVPGVVFATRELLPQAAGDEALEQVANVATLPGIVRASYAMPDLHWGYGFPIGGVAATDIDAGGVISPGGVGFDISCGVRLLAAGIDRGPLAPRIRRLMDILGDTVPRGLGHQVCSDHVRVMDQSLRSFGIELPDRQLACAPAVSTPGRAYLGAMAAANHGRANRQLLTEAARHAFTT